MVSDIPYSTLRTFYNVARNNAFKKAALDLYVTAGAVSQQIRSLEKQLGKRLFERSNQKTALTPDGLNLFHLVTPVVERLETLKEEFEQISGSLRGKVKVASFEAMLVYVLPKYIKKFRSEYPECEIILFNVAAKQIQSMVLSGEVDFGIGSVEGLPDEFVSKELCNYERYFIAPIGHPLSKKRKLTLKDIARYPIVMPDRETMAGQLMVKDLQLSNPNYKVTVEARSWEVVIKYVELGFGTSLLPGICIQAMKHRHIYSRSVPYLFGRSRYGILLKKGKHLSPVAKELVRFLAPNFDWML